MHANKTHTSENEAGDDLGVDAPPTSDVSTVSSPIGSLLATDHTSSLTSLTWDASSAVLSRACVACRRP